MIVIMGRRIAYGLLGVAIGLLINWAIDAVRRPHDWFPPATVGPCLGCAALVVWIAERKGKVKSIEELHRPLTLFPRDPA
jgi:hypothetical protein